MQQESQLIEFTITKLIYKAFKFISLLCSKSLLFYLNNLIILSSLTFYINNFLDKFCDFEHLFIFLRDYFFLQVE